MIASNNGYVDIVKALLAAGARIDAVDDVSLSFNIE